MFATCSFVVGCIRPGPDERILWRQRFKCFGDMDAPDWILAEIAVLAKLVGRANDGA